MTRRMLRMAGTAVLGLTLIGTGCKSKQAVAVRNQDGSITNPDGSVTYPAGSQQAQAAEQPNAGAAPAGSVTNSDGSVTYPAGSQAARSSAAAPTNQTVAPAATSAPVAREVAPAPAARPEVVVPSGARVEVSLSQTLSAKNSDVGTAWSGVLAQPVVTSGGATVFNRGDRVEGTVSSAKGRGRFKGAGDIGITLTSIAGHEVSTTEYSRVEKGKGKRTAVLAGGGGGLGALIGGLAGGGKGALIGGLAGAGAGTAGAAFTGNKDVVIPAETVVVFRTTSAIRVR